MTVWVTSDHHFMHENIIKHCNRPFVHSAEMDEELIRRWNVLVGVKDTVWHLGDVSLSGDAKAVVEILSRLNGEIHLLTYPWHHDRRWLASAERVLGGTDRRELAGARNVILEPPVVVLKKPEHIVLCHYPFEEWDRKHHGSYHFHGHQHGNGKTKMERRVDVSVDCWSFAPASFEELRDLWR